MATTLGVRMVQPLLPDITPCAPSLSQQWEPGARSIV